MRKALVTLLVLSNIFLTILVISFITGYSPLPPIGKRAEEVERLRVSLVALDSSLATGLSVSDLRDQTGDILTNYRLARTVTPDADWDQPTMTAIITAGAVADAWTATIRDDFCSRRDDERLSHAPSCSMGINAYLENAGVEERVSFAPSTTHNELIAELLGILSTQLDKALTTF